MSSLSDRLKERKLVQWALAYLAGAWMIWQVMDVMGERWGLTPGIGRALDILLIVGFLVTLVLAWYHGEKGRQRVSGPELLMIGGLFGLTAAALTLTGSDPGDALDDLDLIPVIHRDKPALAVLPFANISAAEENEYFTRGIHDDILTQLSKIRALDVIARTSVMQYAGTEKTIQVIGRELGVHSLVEGGVQRAGNLVRINVQLIDADSEAHLWAQTYSRELSAENIFAVQAEIAHEIAEALKATLTSEEGSRISRAPTGNLTAYDFFLRGREAYGRYTAEDNDEAIRLFREALDRDPDYAGAWAGLGDGFGLRVSNYGFPLHWADSALAASQRAIELDPDLADGFKALGLAYAVKGAYDQALPNYLRAVDLDPSYVSAVSNLASIYFWGGDFGAYHHWSMRAFRLAPNFRYRRTEVAWSYWSLQDYDLAERWTRESLALGADESEALTLLSSIASLRGELERGIELAEQSLPEPPTAYGHMSVAWAALFARDFERALPAAEEAGRLDPGGSTFHWHYSITTLGFALLAAGETERGMRVLAEAQELMEALMGLNDRWSPVWEMASIHAARGDVEKAIEWAERAYEENGYRFPRYIGLDPMFDSVRDDPRFQAIVDRMQADVEEMRRRIEREEIAAGIR